MSSNPLVPAPAEKADYALLLAMLRCQQGQLSRMQEHLDVQAAALTQMRNDRAVAPGASMREVSSQELGTDAADGGHDSADVRVRNDLLYVQPQSKPDAGHTNDISVDKSTTTPHASPTIQQIREASGMDKLPAELVLQIGREVHVTRVAIRGMPTKLELDQQSIVNLCNASRRYYEICAMLDRCSKMKAVPGAWSSLGRLGLS